MRTPLPQATGSDAAGLEPAPRVGAQRLRSSSGEWLRRTAASQACVNDAHEWSAISTVYGYARGQAADHTSAMNAVRAVLRAWGEYPEVSEDNEHQDDVCPRPPAPGLWPNTLGRAAMR